MRHTGVQFQDEAIRLDDRHGMHAGPAFPGQQAGHRVAVVDDIAVFQEVGRDGIEEIGDIGPVEAYRLESVVDLVGGVPSVLECIAEQGRDSLSAIVADPDAVWRVLGALATEIRGAYQILAADGRLQERMENLAENGPQPEDVTLDPRLVLAGMAHRTPIRDGRRVQVRAPMFADIALTS